MEPKEDTLIQAILAGLALAGLGVLLAGTLVTALITLLITYLL